MPLSGFLIVLLATPCSAPYVGTAAAFALTRGISEILMIFLMLGLGLAIPYIFVACCPRVVAYLPRPGPWMIVLRRWLGLALAATALWLVVIGARYWGIPSSIIIGVGFCHFGTWPRRDCANVPPHTCPSCSFSRCRRARKRSTAPAIPITHGKLLGRNSLLRIGALSFLKGILS